MNYPKNCPLSRVIFTQTPVEARKSLKFSLQNKFSQKRLIHDRRKYSAAPRNNCNNYMINLALTKPEKIVTAAKNTPCAIGSTRPYLC
jgi:hypothetical protein